MADLIDRQAAIDAIDKERKENHLFNTAEDGLLYARGIVNTLPPVDAVQVVRCKECKWWHDWNGECYGNSNMWYGVGLKADDFCSLGERRKNAAD